MVERTKNILIPRGKVERLYKVKDETRKGFFRTERERERKKESYSRFCKKIIFNGRSLKM